MWTFNKGTHEWNYTLDDEILIRVAVEEWDNFLRMYGGSSINHRGIYIPVPPRRVFIDEEEKRQQEALKKVVMFMLGDDSEV